ncbi:HAD superfamily hydrolase (TIGR01509 family) [Arthrobacter oryzae]|uniref:HAD family hydrolase n=1 Tax=Arthrobacter oryzae TaxID=409290 RepID=UPI002787A517|nr:HAD family hydrolase [Arthrobacter oryzae]MDP9987436.1 HAD superfamily hydrolase (TIGR01509 family) [Arthrobacter oryzae]
MNAVLLDLDGTLVDTEPYWVESQRLLAERFSVDWTPDDELALIGHSMSYAAHKLISSGVKLTKHEVIDFRLAHVISRLEQHIPWQPGAQKLLQELRENDVPCALVTMSPRSMASAVISALPAAQFDATVTGSDCVNGKPHPEPYLRAMSLLGTSPERAIAVEDSNPGVQSAENAGLNVLVVPGPVPVPEGPLRTKVNSLEDVDLAGLRRLLPELLRRN